MFTYCVENYLCVELLKTCFNFAIWQIYVGRSSSGFLFCHYPQLNHKYYEDLETGTILKESPICTHN